LIVGGFSDMAARARKLYSPETMQCACGFKRGSGNLEDEQSIDEFLTDPDRNSVCDPRSVIYLINFEHALSPENMDMVSGWVSAFYLPLRVKVLDMPLSKVGRGVVASTPAGDYKIRARKCKDRMFDRQLSINDLIDAVIGSLPEDAFCACGVTAWDTFETSDDDFICGRAYGGSRVAVVSTARYAPSITPLTHSERKRGTVTPSADVIQSHRVAPTVTHEIGHCFGLDHCVRYNCAMRETLNLDDDLDTHFDLCPHCATKLSHAMSPLFRHESRRKALSDWFEGHSHGWRDVDAAWLTKRTAHVAAGDCHRAVAAKLTKKRGRQTSSHHDDADV
jgi:predicted Zn-dependent protease